MAAPCRRLRCSASALTAVLLVIAGIETNPGPAAAVKMGLLNARSMSNEGSLVQDIVVSQNLDVIMAVATFEATEAAASVIFTTLASVKNNYFDQLNFKYESHESRCDDYIAVTHNHNCKRLSSSFKRQCLYALA